MIRGLKFLSVLLTSLFVLTGCVIVGGGGNPFEEVPQRSVSNDREESIASGTLGSGSSTAFRLTLTQQQVNQQAIYFELDQELDLYVYNSNGSLYATSSSADRFGSGKLGLQSLEFERSGELEFTPTAVSVMRSCRGSCVIRDADASEYIVEIVNDSGSSSSYTLYSYVTSYEDTGEFENDNPANATPINPADDTAAADGAIESLGDIDYFRPTAGGQLRFDTAAPFNVIAEVITDDGQRFPLEAGGSQRVVVGDLIAVWVDGDASAGVAAKSAYYLYY